MKKIYGILLSCALGISLFGGIACLKSKPAVRPVEATATKTITVAPKDLKNRGNWTAGDYENIDRTGTTTTGITFFGGKARWHDDGFRIGGGQYFTVSSTKYNFLRIDFTLDVTGQSSAHTDYCYYMADDADGANIKSHRIDDYHGYWEEDTPKNSVSARNTGNYIHVRNMVITVIAPTYNVAYDANGGSGETIDANDYVEGTKATLITSTFTAPEGKAFSHWNTKADNTGTNYKPGAQVTMNSNITLYAQYANKMTVSVSGYEGNYDGLEHTGAVNVSVPESGYVVKYGTSESSVTLTECPTFSEVGEHSVYYAVTATDYGDERGSFQVIINENDKSELTSILANANYLYNGLDDKSSTEAVALYDAIVAGQAVKDNKNVTEKEISDAVKAIDDATSPFGRDTIVDDNSGTTVVTKDGTLIPNQINLSVEVKADVKAEEGSAEREAIEAKLAADQQIVKVFDVKLIKNEGGVETEVQPSEIKEGMIIIISIELPEDVSTEDLDILHIHSESEMEFIEGYELASGVVQFEVSKLSELAFINKVNAPAPVDPSGSNNFPGWGIALIVIGAILLLGCLCYLFLFFALNKWIKEGDKALRAFVISKKDGRAKVMVMSFKFMYRDESEIFNSKEDALR